ncbi:unnamed protein product, partial [Rotaria socialis]
GGGGGGGGGGGTAGGFIGKQLPGSGSTYVVMEQPTLPVSHLVPEPLPPGHMPLKFSPGDLGEASVPRNPLASVKLNLRTPKAAPTVTAPAPPAGNITVPIASRMASPAVNNEKQESEPEDVDTNLTKTPNNSNENNTGRAATAPRHNEDQANCNNNNTRDVQGSSMPASVDWRQRGAVTHVRNQGQQGICYVIAAFGALEGAHRIVNDVSIIINEHDFVDPTNVYAAGGLVQNVWLSVRQQDAMRRAAGQSPLIHDDLVILGKLRTSAAAGRRACIDEGGSSPTGDRWRRNHAGLLWLPRWHLRGDAAADGCEHCGLPCHAHCRLR